MRRPTSWYWQFGFGVFAGNILIGLYNESLGRQVLIKAVMSGLLAVALLVIWDRRKTPSDGSR